MKHNYEKVVGQTVEVILNHTCYHCEKVFTAPLHQSKGLTGRKLKGFIQCPQCGCRKYVKKFLDFE